MRGGGEGCLFCSRILISGVDAAAALAAAVDWRREREKNLTSCDVPFHMKMRCDNRAKKKNEIIRPDTFHLSVPSARSFLSIFAKDFCGEGWGEVKKAKENVIPRLSSHTRKD